MLTKQVLRRLVSLFYFIFKTEIGQTAFLVACFNVAILVICFNVFISVHFVYCSWEHCYHLMFSMCVVLHILINL